MKAAITALAVTALAISSCSTAYKTGQTPDDVYYSPGRPAEEYVVVDRQDDRSYEGTTDYYEDRYLRMRVQNRYRWSAFDDYYMSPYSYSPYSYGYGFAGNWNNPWNSYWAWNNYYNPYCGGGGVIIKNPGTYVIPSKPVAFNPASYNGGGTNTRSTASTKYYPGYLPSGNNNNTRYNNANANGRSNSGSLGNSIRRVFNNGNSSSGSSYDGRSNNAGNNTPTRSYNPSSSSNNSSSSSSGSSGSSSGGSSGGGGGSRPIR